MLLKPDEASIRGGVKGVVSVMREIGILPKVKKRKADIEPLVAKSSSWVRAPQSGILRTMKTLGAQIEKGEFLGFISDPFGEKEETIKAPASGIIIGRTNMPLVNEGEALFHIARFESADEVVEQVEDIQNQLDPATDELEPNEPPIV